MMIHLTDLQKQIYRGPALVIGPGMTTSLSRESEFLNLLRRRYSLQETDEQPSTYLDHIDSVVAIGRATEMELRKEAESFFSYPLACNPQLEAIIKANWTAVISLSSDDHVREKLGGFFYSKPTKWSVTTVACPADIPSLTTVPYYAMMGDIRDKRESSKLAISRSQYLKRMRTWSNMLTSLPDVLKSDPLIFLGTSNIVERVCDFVNELLKLSPRIPKRLIFLATDHAATNPVFRNLVAGICEIQTVECTLRDIGDLLSRENLSIYKLPLFEDSSKRLVDLKAISKVEDQIAYIPRRDE
jgi:hypothetical protein